MRTSWLAALTKQQKSFLANTSAAVQCMGSSKGSSSRVDRSQTSQAPDRFRQRTLNRHFGLPLEQIQTRVDSLWRRQVAGQATPAESTRAITSTVVISDDTPTSAAMATIADSSDIEQDQEKTSKGWQS